jgi:hypothetical protein
MMPQGRMPTPEEARAELARRQAAQPQNAQRMPTPEEARAELAKRQAAQPQGSQGGAQDFMAGLGAFNQSVEKYPLGLLQLIAPQEAKRIAEKNKTNVNEDRKTSPKSVALGDFLGDLGVSLPAFGGAGAVAAKLAPNLARTGAPLAARAGLSGLEGALGGAALGGSEYVGDEHSRLGNAASAGAFAGTAGAALPGIGKILSTGKNAAKKTYNYFANPEKNLAESFYANIPEKNMDKALKNAKLAEEYGLKLTPAEASGSPIQARAEGHLGTTLPGTKALYEAKEQQKEAQQKLIDKLLGTIAPASGGSAAKNVREAAAQAIKTKEKALQEKARPFYEKAESQTISTNKLNSLLRDENIGDAYQHVYESSVYADSLKDFPLTSVKRLDLVKKRMDDQIAAASISGRKHEASLLLGAKNKLVDALDKVSPEYAKARGIYEEGSPAIDLLRKGDIGKIANLGDPQLQNVSKIIFDPQETDEKAFHLIKNAIQSENPDAWNGIIRNEMERRIANKALDKTGNAGSNFYDSVLSRDVTFKQFHDALAGLPGDLEKAPQNAAAQKALVDMRELFRDLLNNYTPKTSRGFSESHVNQNRNLGNLLLEKIENLLNGQYDEVAVKMVTDGKWRDQFLKIAEDKMLTKEGRQKRTMMLMDKLLKSQATSINKDEDVE